jgi:hypothetical protein
VNIESLDDRCVSHWLRNAYITASQRDPLDALHDAKLLVHHLETVLKQIKEQDEILELRGLK